jgi:hypothetical protein
MRYGTLTDIIAYHPARGLIDIREMRIEIRQNERVRCKLDKFASMRLRPSYLLVGIAQLAVHVLDRFTALVDQVRQIHNDSAVNSEQQ